MRQQLENQKTGTQIRQIHEKSIFTAINSRELAENILLFLLGRIVFMDYMFSPFGVALFSSLFYRKKRISYVAAAIIGAATSGLAPFFFKYTGAILVICTVQIIFRKELEHKKRTTSFLAATALFINGSIYVLFEGFFLFDIMLLLLECFVAFGSFFVFDNGIMSVRRYQKAFELPEIMNIILLLGAGILSIGLTENLEPIAHVASIFIILFMALTYGAAPCAPAGVVFGLALGVGTTFVPQLICIYTISALCCGLFYHRGRMAVSVAFGLSSLLATLILCPEANGILTVSYVTAACLLLFFVPDRMLIKLATFSRLPRKEATMTAKINEALSEKFSDIINSTQSVSNIFYEVVDSLRDPFYETTTAVFEATADKVCSDCSLCRFCWQKDKSKTLSVVENMCLRFESKNVFSNKDIPEEFTRMCIRSEMFASELAKNLESFKVAKMWSGKLMESKRLVAEQFKNISMILSDTKESIKDNIAFLPEAERRIARELEKLGIATDKISVYAKDGYYVKILMPVCDSKAECDLLIPSVISEVLEVDIERAESDCGNVNCAVAFYEKPSLAYNVATATATKKNSPGSGDSMCYFSPDAGKLAIVLCDGMGSGEHANYQSNIAAELSKKLMTAGFNKETCVRLINDILITASDRDSFSTMDMCIVNLYTGEVEIIKSGSPDSFVGQGKEFARFEGSSLPVGMISDVEPDIYSASVQSGDYIIMATDGITDALCLSDKDEMEGICCGFDGTAQELCDKILERALDLSDNTPTDDMTVTVCKICNQ